MYTVYSMCRWSSSFVHIYLCMCHFMRRNNEMRAKASAHNTHIDSESSDFKATYNLPQINSLVKWMSAYLACLVLYSQFLSISLFSKENVFCTTNTQHDRYSESSWLVRWLLGLVRVLVDSHRNAVIYHYSLLVNSSLEITPIYILALIKYRNHFTMELDK